MHKSPQGENVVNQMGQMQISVKEMKEKDNQDKLKKAKSMALGLKILMRFPTL